MLDILLYDETNPRSLGYQLARIRDAVPMLPARSEGSRPATEKAALKLYTAYRVTDIREIFSAENANERLAPWLDTLSAGLEELHTSITETYFTYVEEQVRIGEMNG